MNKNKKRYCINSATIFYGNYKKKGRDNSRPFNHYKKFVI